MITPSPSRWQELFDVAMSIIAQANRNFDIVGHWTFGGGTALMLQIDHRESHDIDLFLGDPQRLPYLNPETQEFALTLTPSSYFTDGTQSLKIAFDDVGEIDFICCLPVLNEPTFRCDVRGVSVDLESPAEIIAKKIYYRGARLQPRDIFDIAAVAHSKNADYLAQPLSRFPDEVTIALHVTERYGSSLLDSVLAGLNVRPKFESLRATARDDTVAVLRQALLLSKA